MLTALLPHTERSAESIMGGVDALKLRSSLTLFDAAGAPTIVAQARSSDIGYAADAGRVGEVFSTFARRRWGWEFDADDVRLTTDVSVAIVETLARSVAMETTNGIARPRA